MNSNSSVSLFFGIGFAVSKLTGKVGRGLGRGKKEGLAISSIGIYSVIQQRDNISAMRRVYSPTKMIG